MKRTKLIFVFLILIVNTLRTQASLTIESNSMRSMTIKVMKEYNGKGTLHEAMTISAYTNNTVYFFNSDYYFTKTRKVLRGKEPIYRYGQTF